MNKAVGYYYDSEAKERIPTDQDANPLIDMKKTRMDSTNAATIYLKNEIYSSVTVKTSKKDDDLSISDSEISLSQGEIKPMQLSFKPNPERLEALNTLLDVEVEIG